jgi:NAD-dependent DNA ligase
MTLNQPNQSGECEQAGDLRDTLLLCMVPGVGPRTRRALLEHFGTADQVLAAPADQLRAVRGVGRELSVRIATARRQIDVDRELAICREHEIDIVCDTDPRYPIHDSCVKSPILPACCFGEVTSIRVTSWPSRSWEPGTPPTMDCVWWSDWQRA